MSHKYTNEPIHESSPYLLQHAHNPVHWYPWGEKALQKAKDENKMLIISIGYAACHWCHVMEQESFEDTTVARIMNDNFVCIKVDREERPDVDQIYMYAAVLIHGSGGWPLNVLALPDGKPFFAGTYFPKSDWIKILNYFIDIQKTRPNDLKKQAEQITHYIHAIENVPPVGNAPLSSLKDMDSVFNLMKSNIDFKKGGTYGAPKFPMPSVWEYLLHYHYLSNNPEALKAVNATLENLAFGGIYDHLGGGFARYSTDADWHVPHFEKMLYDNAQLVSLYSHAYQLTKNPLYKKVVYETLGFIEREMTSPENGFYSSLDADSESEEGKFYVWTKKEIDSALGDFAPLFNDYYNITSDGNWEDSKNILFRKNTDDDLARKHKLTLSQSLDIIKKCKATLLEIRSKRTRPALDDKVITSWNALMLTGYIQAYRVFGDEKFLKAATANASFILKNAINRDGSMNRIYKNGRPTVTAFLDDYAFTISSFIELYQATFDENWLYNAQKLADYAIKHFLDSQSGMFYYTHNQSSDLISRKMEITDNVIPSSNAQMAINLFLLGHYFPKGNYLVMSRQMLANIQKSAHQNMFYYSHWGRLELYFLSFYEVAIVGNDFLKKREELDNQYLPNILFLGCKKESSLELLENKYVNGQTTIYVCRDGACQLPVTQAKDAIKQIIK
ncbi:MAG: thioredoxin domain-containing protein [Bacteroidales bacterium]